MRSAVEETVQQVLNFWVQLSTRRQIIVLMSAGLIFAALFLMVRLLAAPTMTLLYAGLESDAAGDVITVLEQRGVAFEVRGGSIFVDAKTRDRLRLTLAGEGLPANGTQGYELLDSLTGFGTTSQMFDAAYWRAKEGELARTIVANPQISNARVHIASSGSNPFQRGIKPKASVSLTPVKNGITLVQAEAVRFLVASAVAGLSPDDVIVIDANGSLLGQADEGLIVLDGNDKARILRDRIQRLLEARVGFGNAIVEVSVDTVTESETINQRIFDPDTRVAISTETEERTTNSKGVSSGDVTVASNLPDQDGGERGDGASSQNSETRERINYEVSETAREVIKAAGAVRRLTVAVLVNNSFSLSDSGEKISTPREPQELEALRELVSSAVGFDEARGDIITIKSMALISTTAEGTGHQADIRGFFGVDLMLVIQMTILALVATILGIFVVRPILANSQLSQSRDLTALPISTPENGVIPEGEALSGEVETNEFDLPDFDISNDFDNEFRTLPDIPMTGSSSTDPVARLRKMIGDRQEETVETLRTWLEETEESV